MMRRPAIALCGIAVCVWFAAVGEAQTLVPPTTSGRQLVVPFENAANEPRVFWLGEGSAVLLTDDLQTLGVPAISRDDRLRAFERLRVPRAASLSHATAIRLGQVVGASQVVVGSFELDGNDLVVRARAIRLDTGRITPEIVSRGALGDIFGVYAGIARRLVPNATVTADQMEQGHPPLAAFEPYIKGVLAEGSDTRINFLNQALKFFPGFQRARIALWDVYTADGEHPRALAIVRQVPSASRASREARFRAALSLTYLNRHQEAYNALQQLNVERPDPALLNNLGVVQLRRPASAPGGKAVSYFGQAVTADATDPDLFFNLGYAYWITRDPKGAIYWLREAVRRNPADDAAHYVLGVALQDTGSTVEAAREKELARRLSSSYEAWEVTQPGVNRAPRGLERMKTDIDVVASLRVEDAIMRAEQRDQRALATFHLERGRRLFDEERDEEAIADLRRVVYLSPYESEAHVLLGRLYLRLGRPEDAVTALTIAAWSDPDNAEAVALLEQVTTR